MFTNDEKTQLIGLFTLELEKNKAGKADARAALAELLVGVAHEFLKGRYNTDFGNKQPDGMVQTRDTISKEDFRR